MKKDIKELEKKLKEITGEDTLPTGEPSGIKSKKTFNSSAFTKLAEELKRIFEEDEKTPNTAFKS